MNTAGPSLAPGDRKAVTAVSWLAAVGALVTLVGLTISLVDIFTAESLAVPDALLTDPLPTAEATGGSVTATASHLDLQVENAPAAVRAPLAAAAVVSALTPLSVSLVVFFVGRQVTRQHFRRRLGYAVAVLAGISFGSSLFTPFLHAIAASEALRLSPFGAEAPFGFTLDATAITVTALLLIIAVLLVVSERMQRETEGLV